MRFIPPRRFLRAAFLSALICRPAGTFVAPQREPIEVRPMAAAGSDASSTHSWWGANCCRRNSACLIARRKLPFLARGWRRPYIREKLFISKNTVATHIRLIYGKLDIHSKEELIDLATEAARK